MTTQTVLVTGAASGIGLASVKLLRSDGHRVVAFDIQGDRMTEALGPDTDGLVSQTGDVSDDSHCARAVDLAVERFGRLDSLIHWGAAHSSTRWTDLAADEFNRILTVNVTGSAASVKAASSNSSGSSTESKLASGPAAKLAAIEVWGAVLASTLTTLAVFLPIIFLEGEAGQLFVDIALAISAAVGLSLIVSIIVIPTASARTKPKRP